MNETKSSDKRAFDEALSDMAFPIVFNPDTGLTIAQGLTKREYFAAMAMQGLLANSNFEVGNRETSLTAVDMSDQLIKALSEEK